MSLQALFNDIPFVEELGIELTDVGDGHAEARLPLRDEHSSNPNARIAHGGVTYSLVDTVGGAAVVSLSERISPTVDMRIDYLAPATDDLRATAEVVRNGGSVAVVDVEVYDADDHHVASARGTYKTDGDGGQSPWTEGVDAESVEKLSD
ncbi:PaaI family thioesterase [Halomicroarcula sp. S1AR25-4]|uniref:PaaI family thioesterase n=1 Tax=Haloarcula sp. S1AR25-4 TaxID=2950538 RepID=UPI0028768537|nr:PaaI family thioesterase [Halomicroarcula sp. S1AR25-4]MDS0279113.1 PaaI family thioesterase [Halomicroarcula sp. S1AR25-4]